MAVSTSCRQLISAVVYLSVTSLLEASHYFDIEYEADCPDPNSEFIRYSYMVPWGVPDRHIKTAPPQISIRTSSIPKAGLGTFAETFLQKGTWLAEYEGLVVPKAKIDLFDDDTYMWRVFRDGEIHHYIDALHTDTSNWIRFVNGARNPQEQNVIVHQCYDKIFYRLMRDVAPGTELLIYYGEEYTSNLGVDTSVFDEER